MSDREFIATTPLPALPALPPTESPCFTFVPSGISSVFGPTRVTYARWTSLALPPPSPSAVVDPATSEDFFSSDLSDERLDTVFGKAKDAGLSVLGLLMGEDESYPEHVRGALNSLAARFAKAAGKSWNGESGVVRGPGAGHAPEGEPERREMEGRIVRFLLSLTR